MASNWDELDDDAKTLLARSELEHGCIACGARVGTAHATGCQWVRWATAEPAAEKAN